jgi:FkbM family methyltransferase
MRSLRADARLGWLIRAPLRLIPEGARVPILATPARGKRWIARSGPHSCWLGVNEYRKRRQFGREVQRGMVVWDVGANVGSYTILSSVLVGEGGHVVAIEPLQANLRHLRAHIALNDLGNVTVLEHAVSDRSGIVRFAHGPDRLQGRVDDRGEVRVDAVTLDEILAAHSAPVPDCIKMDIEGGEHAALRGARRLLRDVRPILFLATHGDDVRSECVQLLESTDYRVDTIAGDRSELIARPRAIAP